MKRFALLMLCLLCATIAYAQDPDALDTVEEKKEGVNVSLTVNYGSAYREHSWVPVDILVSNYEYDISGHVEVRSFDMSGEIQSPIYRLPAECPENSRKRYRLYCHMDGAAGLEARLYHKNRVINQASANIQVRAIEPQDFLCLVLDNITEDYGFLGTELFKANTNVRLHRETLTTARLGLLADYPQCYSSFDIIIMGDVDPNRIAESHRDLLRSYVEQGGVLAVCTGGQAENYRGSWLEDLLGVQIGPETFTSETAIAQAAFPPVQQAGAVADRNCALATLTPVAEGVQTLGDSLVLATLRRYGSGYADTIA
ncbi:MAG: hypothetical protein IT368_16395, partial [Candidatus Hydrogenedentes bacterium]|nr:hypothetical protein [Candidatus Hydrogenedentota bacterium]